MAEGGRHGAFADVLAAARPELRPVCEALRRRILSLDRDSVEVVWPRMGIASYGVGPRKMTEHYAYISAHASHVNLGFYHGAVLADPLGLLEGTGRRLRHVKIADVRGAAGAGVAGLLRRAIADRRRRAGD